MDKLTIKKRIYYHDTDCGGVVYYANYLKYFEEARTEYLRAKGVDLQKLTGQGIFFVVGSAEIRYRCPAKYQDEVLITVQIKKKKAASLEFHHEVKKGEVLLVECKTKLVSVDKEFNPQAIPKNIVSLL